MAQIKKNLFVQGASGMLGKQLVYKTINGKTYISTRPVRSGQVSEAQKRQNMNFKYASIFAKTAIADEVMGPIYAEAVSRSEKFRSAYQLAVTDYLRPPEIGNIIVDSAASGSSVLIEAIEDPLVANVQVAIIAEDGSTIDNGEALLTSNGIQWEYILPVNIPEGGKLQVKAYDLPGNVASMDFEIEPLNNNDGQQT